MTHKTSYYLTNRSAVRLFMLTVGVIAGLVFILSYDNRDPVEEKSSDKISEETHNDHERYDEILTTPLDHYVRDLESRGPINSIVISQKGEIKAEEYFGRMSAGRGYNIKSASKSILSLLVGIAIDEGYLEGVDQEIGEFFPEYFSSNDEPEKYAITIEDLLTMRAGLASTSRANYGRWVTSRNWVHYALNQPLVGVPGEDRIYSTGSTHILSVILERASGLTALQFANRYLFHPMDIEITGWDRDPQGYYFGGNNMAMRSRDMIKVGQLMMDVGVYNGEQLVSEDWIVRSVEPVTGRRAGIDDYGYLWFRRMSSDFHMVYAFGSGGQYIMIIPELESVIAVTTRNQSGTTNRSFRRSIFTVIDNQIIPWLEASYKQESSVL